MDPSCHGWSTMPVEAGRMTTRDALDLLRLPVEDYRQLADSAREELARR